MTNPAQAVEASCPLFSQHRTFFAAGLLVALLVTCVSTLQSQNSSPEAALEEIATTDKLELVRKHLPAAMADSLAKLSAPEQARILEGYFPHRRLEAEKASLSRKPDGAGWELAEKDGPTWTIIIKPAFYRGAEAIVPVEARSEKNAFTALVKLELEDGEWRLSDIGEWRSENIVASFSRKLAATSLGEHAALGLLSALSEALETYAERYPDVGFPFTLEVLAGAGDTVEPSPQHAKLVARPLDRDPLIVEGYEFRYRLIDSGEAAAGRAGRYQITARPLHYERDGVSSFYTEEKGPVYFTREDRGADSNDTTVAR